jgi:hypothetical protein
VLELLQIHLGWGKYLTYCYFIIIEDYGVIKTYSLLISEPIGKVLFRHDFYVYLNTISILLGCIFVIQMLFKVLISLEILKRNIATCTKL